MTEQRTVSTPKDLGPQVSKPTLSASVGASNVGNGFSAKTNGLSRLFKPAPLNNISSIERPKTALGERQRRTSSELGSKLDNLSLGTPPRPGTAVPSHRRHGSFQLPTFKTSKTGPSPPTTPSAPSGPTSPFSSFQRGAQSPSPQKTSQTFDGRTRRSSFTGGHANYAAGTNLPSSIQRSLSPLSPQSPQRSLSPLSFSSGSPTSSFSSGSPPLSRVASPDTSPGFASMHVGGRNRTPSFGEMFCNPARSQSFSATPLSFSGRARSGSGSATTSPTKPGYFRVNRNTR